MTENYGGTSWSPPTDDASTPQVAKEQAQQVATGAVQAGSEVAGTAIDQGKQVAAEALSQARDLAGEAKAHAQSQVSEQHQKAVTGLRGLGDSLQALASGDVDAAPGIATDLAKQAADHVQAFAAWVESREPGEILTEAKDYARRNPGTFLVGAALAGVLMGRLTRGVVAVQHEASSAAPATESRMPGSDSVPFTTDPYAAPVSYASSDTFGNGDINGVTSPQPDINLDSPVGGVVRP